MVIWHYSRDDTLSPSTENGLVKFRLSGENCSCKAIIFSKGLKFLFFKELYGSDGTSPVCLAGFWQDDNAKAMDGVHALFNPKLEFYNIAAFIIMNFIENFF